MSKIGVHVNRVAPAMMVIALAGCGGGGQGDQDGPPSLTAEEANEQYHEEAAMWDLPAGWEWPAEPYSGEGPDGVRAVYGLGIGQVDATWYWFCAWNRTLVDAGTEESQQAALEEVLRVRETPYYQVGLEDTEVLDGMLNAAEDGDFSELATNAELNCPEGP